MRWIGSTALSLILCGTVGCRLPGKPAAGDVPVRPDQVNSFDTLYQRNCQACHGVQGKNGMAVSLANPAYIGYAGRDHIQQITANGIGGSLMPAFAADAGGMLTQEQVQVLADGIVERWSRPAALGGLTPPPYSSTATGNAGAGEALYRSDCLHCHAPGSSSILDPSYVALVSDGGLRTLLVAGMPDKGMPDWRGYPAGPLTDQQIADLVAFLVAHRTPAAGQTSPNAAGQALPAHTAEEQKRAHVQQKLAVEAGPATGGAPNSTRPAPVATPKRPVSPEP